ncbi:Adaptor protein complex AP-3 delta subunit [Myriangium duriaei CBS 260.36]|uniref:AP-3 complex subunit delta n=1 Tax=Myriangium duriaei CBS 260.36 TaxID=1168546 RepID=A0A9P4MHC7_9PEZI|nr:Adaptor protein complex AP-3 delta subunit [Myriangium duriaei CBS 260.36]
MFEKDLYALIRGMRNHKGNEKQYIQDSIKECRKEIRGADMDQKATALLKLIYLEMFGHDMSWASFNVLEVMSSSKYLQKRVGYLGAVQSFRPDTEVLMLGENLLKKDLTSPQQTTISLALATIPHVVNPSMANSLLADLLPRLSHSSPNIRKKTIVTLYRLAVVYPETLRPAWPKIKERLLDEKEDPSVTAAIVNVICELGWRRPQDFLPLAPRLFELLVNGGNNWMAIKIIKLFAILTPLEPRLIKKLLPPLTTLIKTTPAMSLLYECINGIIQGGILEGAEGTVQGDEVARLCVGKLRGMLVIEGDPNLKYVALLAMARIVSSHPGLVSQHADVILECIDDPDLSIRTKALDLVVGMVDPDNLILTVERLLRQLRESRSADPADDPTNDHGMHNGVVPSADFDDDQAEESLRRHEVRNDQLPPLPDHYRIDVIRKILNLCSQDTYANVNDFDWYVGILVELVRHCPSKEVPTESTTNTETKTFGVAEEIGSELQNVAVRVKSVRPEVAAAAQSLLLIERRRDMFPRSGTAAHAVLGPAAWVAGEYAQYLPDPDGTLTALTHPTSTTLPPTVLKLFLQAIPKVFVRLTSHSREPWTNPRKSHTTLLAARVIHFLEKLVLHPDLDVQERATEYLELMRLASEATTAHEITADGEGPLLLTQALPSLFTGQELNPVAAAALRKVPTDPELDLNSSINEGLQTLLASADYDTDITEDDDETYRLYHEKPVSLQPQAISAADTLDVPDTGVGYQQKAAEARPMDTTEIARLKAERKERYQNDPFYIDPERNSGTTTPIGNIVRNANGEDLDIDSIPVMELQIDTRDIPSDREITKRTSAKTRKRVEIVADENLDGDDFADTSGGKAAALLNKMKKSPLGMDSSGLASLSLTDDGSSGALDFEQRQQEEQEMAAAMKEVERLRLEMQRAQERVRDPEESTVVKRKKKKKARVEALGDEGGVVDGAEGAEGEVVKKKKKKKKLAEGQGGGEELPGEEGAVEEVRKVKKKKKRTVALDDDGTAGE